MVHDPIKPCPFCGGEACLNSNYTNRYRTYFVFVRCDVCGAQAKTFSCKNNPVDEDWKNEECGRAVSAWNTRQRHWDEDYY